MRSDGHKPVRIMEQYRSMQKETHIMAKQSTYTPAKVVSKMVFANGDQRLTIVHAEGKSGHNVKASVKDLGNKDAKASTGARASYQDVDQAKEHFDKLVADAKKVGWTVSHSTRSAFETIPAPAVMEKGSKKSTNSARKS